MAANILDGCTESCGWVTAVLAAFLYGSYGIPIKQAAKAVKNVDPIIMQSYKTIVMFACCWFVQLLGVTPAWTPWGLASGFLWVVGGSFGVYAIREAGMSVAVATWSSVMIGVNFFWGILVFQEPVASMASTVGAFVCLTAGLVGMSYFSGLKEKEKVKEEDAPTIDMIERQQLLGNDEDDADVEGSESKMLPTSTIRERTARFQQQDAPLGLQSRSTDAAEETSQNNASPMTVSSQTPDVSPTTQSDAGCCVTPTDAQLQTASTVDHARHLDTVLILGKKVNRRMAGIFAAVMNGLFAGSSLIPLHYAKRQGFGGANYMISYAVGAACANASVGLALFLYKYSMIPPDDNEGESRFQRAYNSMPDWHLKKLWLPGLMAGILLSWAMFCSILTVTFLGQGIGNSIIQSKILISGLWGIFWYKEITGCSIITKWFLAASTTILGILWLSHERMAATRAAAEHRW